MANDDKDIWESAATELPEQDAPQPEGGQQQPVETPETLRDERGRFAPKADAGNEPAPVQEAQAEQPQPEAKETSQGIPPWRLREEAEARRAAEERARQIEQDMLALRQQIAQQQPQTPETPPDIFEDAAAFVDHRNRAAIDPIKSEVQSLREFYSQRDAVREHGAEKVQAAFTALDQAAKSGDPEAQAAVARVKSSLDPFGDIVKWHQKQTIFSTIGPDPEAFIERTLEERLKDPAYQAKLLERIRGSAQARPSSVTQLPPSLNRATSVAPVGAQEDDDDSDAGLLNSALRR